MAEASLLVLANGEHAVAFARGERGYRPDWFRLGTRPMLRFKDHEFLNIGAVRVTDGRLLEQTTSALAFGGEVTFAGVEVRWSVRVALPADGGSGFTITTQLVPAQPVELLEALTAFELPYEYDGQAHHMTMMCQQPVYRFEGDKELSGAGYMHPFWYYGRKGRAHLTYPSSSPLMLHRIVNADGSNERCVMFVGNWNVCSIKDMFAQPTRTLPDTGLHGMKFLIGAANWNTSLHKDPNFLVEPERGLHQEVTVDVAAALPEGRWDTGLAAGWERLAQIHFPQDGRVSAYEVARSRGASWVEAAEWSSAQFQKPEGCPGFFHPKSGVSIYARGTRPKWDDGSTEWTGQWIGPLHYLGHVRDDDRILEASVRLEQIFQRTNLESFDKTWVMGAAPMYASVMRAAKLRGVLPDTLAKVRQYLQRRTELVLNPPPGSKRGDPGVLAWDALDNLLAADLFDTVARETAAKELLVRINRELEDRFWNFNCGPEGDLTGAGQARPFGHGIALAANMLAYRRFGDSHYLQAAKRFGNLLLGMHFITYNESPSPDLDTRGWAHGATGGRDQWAQIPPWETAFALQQLAHLIQAGEGRPGFYDVLWLHSHTGLAMFPKARTMKRLYHPDLTVTYRPIAELATEREFYQNLPYLAYENPWDQTMLAGYQSVEPLILSLFYGGGLVRTVDDRVLALVPEAATFTPEVAKRFTVELWNPTQQTIETKLSVTQAVKRRVDVHYSGAISGKVSADNPETLPVAVPSRQVVRVKFEIAN